MVSPGFVTQSTLLEVDDLRVSFDTPRGEVVAVDGVSLRLDAGHTLGIVGESGSGKTVLARSILQLVAARNATIEGSVRLSGRELRGLGPKAMRSVWGVEAAMVFQDPMTSLNATMRVGDQITESLRYHLRMGRKEAQTTAVALLSSVGLPEPEAAAPGLSPPAVGRHAPAGDDRHRARPAAPACSSPTSRRPRST